MLSIEQALKTAKQELINAGQTDSPQLDAELLLLEVIKKQRSFIFTWPEKLLSDSDLDCFRKLLEKRLQGLPIAHILGYREFWGLKLKVTEDTLIPRPDTETLVEAVVNLSISKQARILDLGTGTGAIALALKSELPQAEISAVDFSEQALKVAKENSKKLKLDINLKHSNWFSAVDQQKFDCIVSNPPYIEDNDPHLKCGDVKFEPLSALTSGSDGLKDIRMIIKQAWNFLQANGWLAIEHGYNQAEAIQQIFLHNNYKNIKLYSDYGENPRVTVAQKSTEEFNHG